MNNNKSKEIPNGYINLINLPIFNISNKKSLTDYPVKSGFITNSDGTQYKYEISYNPGHGLPNVTTRDVYMACMELSHMDTYKNRKISTNMHELCMLLCWVDEECSYKRITKAFNQLISVSIKYENAHLGIISN